MNCDSMDRKVALTCCKYCIATSLVVVLPVRWRNRGQISRLSHDFYLVMEMDVLVFYPVHRTSILVEKASSQVTMYAVGSDGLSYAERLDTPPQTSE